MDAATTNTKGNQRMIYSIVHINMNHKTTLYVEPKLIENKGIFLEFSTKSYPNTLNDLYIHQPPKEPKK